MSKNIKTQLKEIIGQSINAYDQVLKPKVDDIKLKEEYQGMIIDCMVGEVEEDHVIIDDEVIVIPFKREINRQIKEVNTNITDVEENIIPYLMDVEYNLMMLEEM